MDILTRTRERRERDAKRYAELDRDLCMLCGAYGADKRSLFISCFYDISEAIPEAIDLFLCGDKVKDRGWYLRVCKSCRGELLGMLREWANHRRSLQSLPKDHDGYIDDEYVVKDPEAIFPVRVDGRVVYMTREQCEKRRRNNG